MSDYTDWKKENFKMRMQAGLEKPEMPKFGEEIGINNAIANMGLKVREIDKEFDDKMNEELRQNWNSGGGGNRGDAVISGLQAGLGKGAASKEKSAIVRMQEALERFKPFVEETNRRLMEQRKEADLKESMKPRIMAYIDNAFKMSPADGQVYAQRTLDEINAAMGTDYKLLSIDRKEPWKMMVQDGDYGAEQVDLLDWSKTPAEKKYEIYKQSSEYKEVERLLVEEHDLDRQYKQSLIKKNNAKAGMYGSTPQFVDLPDGSKIDVSGYTPITSQSELNRLSKEKSVYAGTLQNVNSALQHLNELEQLTKNDKLKPTDTYLGGVSQLFNNVGASMGKEESIKVRNKTKVLNDALTSIRTSVEAAKKGGVPGEQMMRRWEEKGILPHINDSAATIREKLNEIHKELSERRESVDLSLKTKRNIDVLDLEQMKNKNLGATTQQNIDQQLIQKDPSLTPEMIAEAQRRLQNGGK